MLRRYVGVHHNPTLARTGLSLAAAYSNGQCFSFYAINQNNSRRAATLNVDGIAAKSLVKWQGTALAAADLQGSLIAKGVLRRDQLGSIHHRQRSCGRGLSSVNNAYRRGGHRSGDRWSRVAVSGGNAAALTGAADMSVHDAHLRHDDGWNIRLVCGDGDGSV